jgi:hypothetical protein
MSNISSSINIDIATTSTTNLEQSCRVEIVVESGIIYVLTEEAFPRGISPEERLLIVHTKEQNYYSFKVKCVNKLGRRAWYKILFLCI